MKSVFTLTKTLTLALMVLVFAGASAATITSDDSSKRKKECCKKQKVDKEVEQAMKELQEAIKELKAELTAINVAEIKAEIAESIAVAPAKMIRTANHLIVVAEDGPKACKKQKIDAQKMNKEMDQVQENMTQMDATLKNDDAKTRKTAEEILETGIKA